MEQSGDLPPMSSVMGIFVAVNDAINNSGIYLGDDIDDKHSFLENHHMEDELQDEEEEISLLKASLCQLEETVPFAIECRGNPGTSAFQLQMKLLDSSDNHLFDPVCDLNMINVENLLTYCEVSPYGDLASMTTKINPEVRLAMECPAERVQIVLKRDSQGYYGCYNRHSNFLAGAEDLIEKELLNKSSIQGVELVLNKLNIYSESGHFKPHTDTPTHDPTLFIGTVVVCLPSAHTGGELVVCHHDKQHVFDFAKRSAVKDEIQFAAFYGDCEHEVLPVTSGHRVTLTYSILRSGRRDYRYEQAYKLTTRSSLSDRKPEIYGEIFHAMVSAAQHSDGYLGILLSHNYTNSGLQAANLKGVDEEVFNILKGNNIPVSVVPIVSAYRVEIPEDDRQRAPSFDVRLLDIPGYPDPRLEVHKNIPTRNVPFLSGWKVNGYLVRDEKYGPQHMGNEIADGFEERIYLKGAIIVGPLPNPPEKEENDHHYY